MNLLLTGASGFIGSNLIRRIIDEPVIKKLVNLDCLTYAGSISNTEGFKDNPKYLFSRTDLRNKAAVAGVVTRHQITRVIHLAAESHVDRSIEGPSAFIDTNIVGTFNLLEACREAWGANCPSNYRFVHVSTDEVYGSLGPTGSFTEQSPYAPNSPYSASKASADMLVRAYHHTYNFPAIITNCSNNYGPYQHPEKFIPVVILNALKRKPIPVYGDGLNVRDWIHVSDHCEALWQVLMRGRCGESYNIGGDNEWSNLEIAKIICGLIDEKLRNPPGESRSLITFVKDRPGHDQRYAVDASKIRQELGWKARPEFCPGLQETIEWYCNRADLGAVCKPT